MYKLATSLLALSLLCSCTEQAGGTSNNDNNTNNGAAVTGRAAFSVNVGGDGSLGDLAVSTSTATAIVNQTADASGNYVLVVTIPGRSGQTDVTTGVTIISKNPIVAGDYDITETAREPAYAGFSLSIRREATDLAGASSTGGNGKLKITNISNNKVSGEYTVSGGGTWVTGQTGEFTYSIAQGTFTDVTLTSL